MLLELIPKWIYVVMFLNKMDKKTCVIQCNKVHLSDCLKYAMLVDLRHILTLYI